MRQLRTGILATALLLTATAASFAAPATKVVTEKDSGTTVVLAPGQMLDVQMTASAGTGYRWQLGQRPPEDVLKSGAIRSEYKASPTIAGASGTEVLEFTAVAAGQTTLTLTYKRAWEPDKPDDRKVSFQVKVE